MNIKKTGKKYIFIIFFFNIFFLIFVNNFLEL